MIHIQSKFDRKKGPKGGISERVSIDQIRDILTRIPKGLENGPRRSKRSDGFNPPLL